jgi:hypothetical protein
MTKTQTSRKAKGRTVEVDEHGLIGFGMATGKSLLAIPFSDMAPAPVIEAPAPAPVEAPAPEVIVVDQAAVEAALGAWYEANEAKKSADKIVRRERKVFDGLPARVYGKWRLLWKPTAREVPDMDAIKAIFEAHGLGEVPMKPCADSPQVTLA